MKLGVSIMNNHSSFYFSVILHYSQDMLLTKPTRHFTLTLKRKKKKEKKPNKTNPTECTYIEMSQLRTLPIQYDVSQYSPGWKYTFLKATEATFHWF